MFKILPIQDPKTQKKCASECMTNAIDNSFAYMMIDNKTEELMGFSQFEISEGEGILFDLKPAEKFQSDYEAMFILGRATMNFIDLCGCHMIKAKSNASDERLLKAIGMTKRDDGIFYCDMTGLFDGSKCSGSH